MSKIKSVKWQAEEIIHEYHCYARKTRQEIIVRIEYVGDKSRFGEFGFPKWLGLDAAMHQCTLEVKAEDIQP